MLDVLSFFDIHTLIMTLLTLLVHFKPELSYLVVCFSQALLETMYVSLLRVDLFEIKR